MARQAARLEENAPGAFFVDDSCIDCGACREIAPATFGRSHRRGQSFVKTQPAGEDHERRALLALVACPTASIGPPPKLPPHSPIAPFPQHLQDGVVSRGWPPHA